MVAVTLRAETDMRHWITVGLLALTAWAHASAEMSEEERALRHFKTVLWPQAYRTQDTELLGRMLHPSFQLIDDQGRVSTRSDELAWVAENTWDPGTFEYLIERLDLYGDDTAIIAGKGVAERYSYRSSNVLIKVDGRWQAIASHVSGVTAH